MNLKEYIMKRHMTVTGLVETNGKQEDERLQWMNDTRKILELNVAEADAWYSGDTKELSMFYTRAINMDFATEQLYTKTRKNFFHSVVATESDVKITHSGMVRDITDTLVNLIGIPIIKENYGLNDLLTQTDYWDIFVNEQLPLTMNEGWGAVKIDWVDEELVLKYYRAPNVDFIKMNNKIIGMIFRDTYVDENRVKYMVCETRFIKHKTLYVVKDLFKYEDDELYPIDQIEGVDLNLENYAIDNMPCLLAEPSVFFKDSTCTVGYGRGMFVSKYSLLDDLDLCLSQSANTTRMSTPHEYIDTNYLEKNSLGMPIMPTAFDRRYTKFVGGRTSDGDLASKEPIFVTQPKLDALSYQTQAVNIQLQIVTGIISPATLGIDIAKKDNADAQREKEKVTIFTRNAITAKEIKHQKSLFNQMLIVENYLKGRTVDENGKPCLTYAKYDISIKYPEFANDSFENKMSVLGEGLLKGCISPEMYAGKLYGDSLSEEELNHELEFLKEKDKNPFGDLADASGNEDNPFGEE